MSETSYGSGGKVAAMVEPGSDATKDSPDDASRSDDATSTTDRSPAPLDGDEPATEEATVPRSDPDLEDIRAAVEARYDFEDFGPADMDRMSAKEWEAVFDPASWITGSELLDRIEADLKDRVRRRNLFAVVERRERAGVDTILAYSDTGYTLIRPDGTVAGEGSIRREVEPIVALCAMENYDPAPMPDADQPLLPHPSEVTGGTGELGNRIMLLVAGIQVIAGVLLLLAPVILDPLIRAICSPAAGTRGYLCTVGPVQGTLVPPGRSVVLTTVVGLGFLGFGGLLFLLVANARLSDRFRAEEYRDRLRAVGVGSSDRPPFLPPEVELESVATDPDAADPIDIDDDRSPGRGEADPEATDPPRDRANSDEDPPPR